MDGESMVFLAMTGWLGVACGFVMWGLVLSGTDLQKVGNSFYSLPFLLRSLASSKVPSIPPRRVVGGYISLGSPWGAFLIIVA